MESNTGQRRSRTLRARDSGATLDRFWGKKPTVLQSKTKATEQFFPVVLFTMPYKRVLIFSRWMKSVCVTIQENGLQQSAKLVL